jgi:hypothetical protein
MLFEILRLLYRVESSLGAVFYLFFIYSNRKVPIFYIHVFFFFVRQQCAKESKHFKASLIL